MSDESHALLGASGAHCWATCAAALRAQDGIQDTSSVFAAEGTAAHTLGSWCLINGKHPKDYPETHITADGNRFKVTPEMVAAVEAYVNRVHKLAEGGDLLVEQKVNYAQWIGVDAHQAFGTSDAVITHENRLTIVDLKYGMGVKVDAPDNEQLMLYALGALYEYEALGPFDSVTMVICQPRIGHVSEHTIDTTSLKTFALNMKAAAAKSLKLLRQSDAPALEDYAPSEGACRWCRAKATCPALAQDVEVETRDLFGALVEHGGEAMAAAVPEDRLAQAMSKVGLIEDFCKAIRAEVERRLLAGHTVEGFKLVSGRKGARKWLDDDEAEQALKSMRLKVDEMYDFEIKSPTSMEKHLAKTSPRRWAKLQILIGQGEGKPSVAPASDPRPALPMTTVTESFAAFAEPAPKELSVAQSEDVSEFV